MRHTVPISKEAAFARGGEQELWLLCPAGGTCLRRTARAGTSRRAPQDGELQRPVRRSRELSGAPDTEAAAFTWV